MVKIAVVGEGAFGARHLEALAAIEDAEVVRLAGADAGATEAMAARFGLPGWSVGLESCLAGDEIDGVILATPTPLHAAQAIQCLEAGKAVQVEIPMADNLADAERLAASVARAGLVAMAGHTRRFNPSHQWIRQGLEAGRLTLRQMDVQTYFLRRTNTNALGQPRSWTDHLLWHHAAHTVDLFLHQTGEAVSVARAIQGPPHPELGVAMDTSVQLKTPSGALCTLSLSFNNDGPLGSVFRYICDEGTFVARYDELVDGWGNAIDVSGVATSMDGVQLQDREFVAAIREGREPRSSVRQVLPAYRVLDQLARDLAQGS
jgi:2-hydroxy-4-carboxymuconate semialdehyde hemiacetal dehydrogenase